MKVGPIDSPPFVIESAIPTSTTYLDSGIELAIINTIAEVANFQVQLYVPSLLMHSRDDEDASTLSTDGLLGELHDRRIDIAVGTISPTIADHRRFDFSVQYTQDMTAWVVPSDHMLPHWMGLLLVFQPTVFGVTFLLLLFLWGASSRIVKLCAFNFRREHQCYRSSATFLLITVGMLLANEPSRFPRTRFLKCILLMWTLFSFYWNSAFNATLMSVITNTVFRGGVCMASIG